MKVWFAEECWDYEGCNLLYLFADSDNQPEFIKNVLDREFRSEHEWKQKPSGTWVLKRVETRLENGTWKRGGDEVIVYSVELDREEDFSENSDS